MRFRFHGDVVLPLEEGFQASKGMQCLNQLLVEFLRKHFNAVVEDFNRMSLLSAVEYDALAFTYISVFQLDGFDASSVRCDDLEPCGACHDILVQFGQIFCENCEVHDSGFSCIVQLLKRVVIGVRLHYEPPM